MAELKSFSDYAGQPFFHDCYLSAPKSPGIGLIPAHRNFLASLDYFRTRFQSEMKSDVKKSESDGLPIYMLHFENLTEPGLRLWLSHIYTYGGWNHGETLPNVGCPCEKAEDGAAVATCFRLSHYTACERLLDHFREIILCTKRETPFFIEREPDYYDLVISGEFGEDRIHDRNSVMSSIWAYRLAPRACSLAEDFPGRALTEAVFNIGIPAASLKCKDGQHDHDVIAKVTGSMPPEVVVRELKPLGGAVVAHKNGELALFHLCARLQPGMNHSWSAEEVVDNIVFKTRGRNLKKGAGWEMSISLEGTADCLEPDVGEQAVAVLSVCGSFYFHTFLFTDDALLRVDAGDVGERTSLTKEVKDEGIVAYKASKKLNAAPVRKDIKEGDSEVWIYFAWIFNRDDSIPFAQVPRRRNKRPTGK